MNTSIHTELMCCTETLLQDILNKKCTKKSVAQTYALAIRSSEDTDWRKVNRAIINRWSRRALEDIKRMAWSGKCFKVNKGRGNEEDKQKPTKDK